MSRANRGAGRKTQDYAEDLSLAVFREMQAYIGFTDADAEVIKSLGPVVRPHLRRIVDRFYAVILNHPNARQVFSGPEQVERLKQELLHWLSTLFGGTYDEAYCRMRSQIGRVHVRIGLAQHYMFSAMEIVWQELDAAVCAANISDGRTKLRSLHKLLSLEIGLMLETYRESYVERERAIERRSMQERVSRAEHLAHIGQLAASLAHEIKNPLAGISGAIQVIRETLPGDNPHRPVLAEVLRQVSRLDETVKDLLIYSRPAPLNLADCDVRALFERMQTVLQGIPEVRRVKLECDLPEHLPIIGADEGQLEQVLMNLLLNAAQASPERGKVRLVARQKAECVELRVEDEGMGMDDETQSRAFEPFFTTRAKGTGLGLSICQKLVEAHRGTISIESSPGKGTALIVTLPIEAPSGT